MCSEQHGDDRTLWGKLYGQEKNLTTSAIARMNLFLHGVEDFQIVRGDTLRNPAFFDGRQPRHLRLRHRQSAVLAGEVGRRGLGQRSVRPQLRRHAARQERRLRLGAAHGQVDGAEDRAAWRWCCRRARCSAWARKARSGRSSSSMDLIEAVIGLAPNLFYGTGLAACILVLRQRKAERAQEEGADRRRLAPVQDGPRPELPRCPSTSSRSVGWYRDFEDVEGRRPGRHARRDRGRTTGTSTSRATSSRRRSAKTSRRCAEAVAAFKEALAEAACAAEDRLRECSAEGGWLR